MDVSLIYLMISTPVTETYIGRETRQASDLHVPYGRLDIRQNSMKIHGANMWNSIPENVKMLESVYLFKQRVRNFY